MDWAVMWATVVIGLLTIFVSVALFMLQRKDKQQQDAMDEQRRNHELKFVELHRLVDKCFNQHDIDEAALNTLKIEIAQNYHSKSEVKELLAELKSYLGERFGMIEKALTHQQNGAKDA